MYMKINPDRLRAEMERNGISKTDLLKMTGISRVTTRNVLNGRHKTQWGTAAVIAKALEVPVEWLVGGRETA